MAVRIVVRREEFRNKVEAVFGEADLDGRDGDSWVRVDLEGAEAGGGFDEVALFFDRGGLGGGGETGVGGQRWVLRKEKGPAHHSKASFISPLWRFPVSALS